MLIAAHFSRKNGIRLVAHLKHVWPILVTWSVFVSGVHLTHSAAPDSSSARHIIIVDTSFSMVRRKQALYATVSNLFSSGLGGHIREGETVEMWTFNENIDSSSIPPRPWRQAEARDLATRAVNFLKNRRFAKRTRMTGLMERIIDTCQRAERFTVVLLSDGDTDVVGTPYDRSINLAYSDYGRAVRKARQTFATILRGREGGFLAWAVIRGGDMIQVPLLPELRPRTATPPKIPLIRTNAISKTDLTQSLPLELNSNLIAEPELEQDAKQQITLTSQSSSPSTTEVEATEEKHIDSQKFPDPTRTEPKDADPNPTTIAEANTENKSVIPPSDDESHNIKSIQDSGTVSLTESHEEANGTENMSLGGGSVHDSSGIEIAKQEDTNKKAEEITSSVIHTSEQTQPRKQMDVASTKLENSRVEIASLAAPENRSLTQKPSRALANVSSGTISDSKWYLIFGVTLLVLAVSILVWTLRSGVSKRQPSIISRSMDHRAK